MNKSGKGLVTVIIIIAVLCIVFLAAGFMVLSAWGGFDWWDKIPESARNVEEFNINDMQQAKVSEFTEFEFSSVSADMDIVYADTDTVTVVLSGSYRSSRGKIKLMKQQLGDSVRIYVDYPKININGLFTWNETHLTITLPQDMRGKELKFSTVSGDVDIPSGIEAESVRANTTSGDIKADYLTSYSFEGDSVSGNVDVSGVIENNVKINTVSGETDIRLAGETESINVGSVSGDVDIILDKVSDFRFKYNTVSGDMTCDFPVYMNGDKSDKAGYTSEGADMEVDINTVSGDLSIRH